MKSIRVKNKLCKQFLKTNSNHYHSKYKFYRNDSKKTWKEIKEIINPKNKGLHTPSTLQYNNEVITDTKTISNDFNEFFANVGRHLASAANTLSVNLRKKRTFQAPKFRTERFKKSFIVFNSLKV